MTEIEILKTSSGTQIYHQGPPLTAGPLPTVIYFALSGEESLTLEPINQPATFLLDEPIRVISFSIPLHGPGLKNTEAMQRWSDAISNGENIFTPFLEECRKGIDHLIDRKISNPEKIAIAGISRGAFVGTHLAALDERIKIILGYAPLTRLSDLNEFFPVKDHPIMQELPLIRLCDRLIDKKIRFYMGNRDVRVNTGSCVEFVRELTEKQFLAGRRSPQVELILFPSIGHKGHGTPAEIFRDGVEWLKKNL